MMRFPKKTEELIEDWAGNKDVQQVARDTPAPGMKLIVFQWILEIMETCDGFLEQRNIVNDMQKLGLSAEPDCAPRNIIVYLSAVVDEIVAALVENGICQSIQDYAEDHPEICVKGGADPYQKH